MQPMKREASFNSAQRACIVGASGDIVNKASEQSDSSTSESCRSSGSFKAFGKERIVTHIQVEDVDLATAKMKGRCREGKVIAVIATAVALLSLATVALGAIICASPYAPLGAIVLATGLFASFAAIPFTTNLWDLVKDRSNCLRHLANMKKDLSPENPASEAFGKLLHEKIEAAQLDASQFSKKDCTLYKIVDLYLEVKKEIELKKR